MARCSNARRARRAIFARAPRAFDPLAGSIRSNIPLNAVMTQGPPSLANLEVVISICWSESCDDGDRTSGTFRNDAQTAIAQA
eukprot:6178583-Pleurochrysis_carterae.AAC.1